MSIKGVHGTIVHLTNLHTWNLHGKVEYISQTSENSFGRLPYLKTGQDSIHMLFFKSICIYEGFYNFKHQHRPHLVIFIIEYFDLIWLHKCNE